MSVDPTIEAYDHGLPDAPTDLDLPRERERFCAMLPHRGRVLDLGAGSGWAARRMRADGFRAIALDRSPGRVSRAQDGSAPPFVLADARALPFVSESFDGVWACASLLHIPKAAMPAVLSAVRRLLPPEGALFVSMKEGGGEAWQGDARNGRRFFAYYGCEELESLLTAAGFRCVDGWISPAPARDPSHRWLSRFAVAE
ncbi:MAG: class I SAM-dependent methyltransferase [Anaerolineae bacterium]